MHRIEFETATQETAIAYRQLLITTPDYLGIFQPHSTTALGKSLTDQWLQKTADQALNWLNEGTTVVIAFEEGSPNPSKALKEDVQYLLTNPHGKRTESSLSQDGLLKRLELNIRDGPIIYSYIKFKLFFELRRELEKQGNSLLGLLEETPAFNFSIDRFFDLVYSPNTSQPKKLELFKGELTYRTARDLRMAGQIAEFIKNTPGAKIISERSELHIGLIPALRVLTNDLLAVINPNLLYKISMLELPAALSPILWDINFWQAIVNQGLDSKKVASPIYDRLLIASTKAIVNTPPWSEYLKEISNRSFIPDQFAVVKLPGSNFKE